MSSRSPFRVSRQACPLNSWPVSGVERTSQEVWESFSQCFTPAVREVVEFAKGIPGFQELSQQDQVMLLKSGTFQVTAHMLHYKICEEIGSRCKMPVFVHFDALLVFISI